MQAPLEGADDPIVEGEQPEIGDLSPDEAAASLAFATNLQENSMPQAPVEQEMAPQDEMISQEPQDGAMAEDTDIEAIVEAKVEEKMADLREELKSALDEEEETEDESEE